MGARWSALFFAPPEFDPTPVRSALQTAVEAVDRSMSTWKSDSDLMCLNRAPVGEWVSVAADLRQVIELGLKIGHESGGLFDIGLGDAVGAWGFGPAAADTHAIKAAMRARRRATDEILELHEGRIRKLAPVRLDLNGIAKGYGVDRLAKTHQALGICQALVGIDGEMRAIGTRPDGEGWTIAVEQPDPDRRAPHSILALQDAAVATSGDYRHWVEVQGRRVSHTMNPQTGASLLSSPASVTVVARTCAEADAWATALMVAGPEAGPGLAMRNRLQALFIMRQPGGSCRSLGIGQLFSEGVSAAHFC
nr:FAD:protein FMN transferase [Rhizobium sp. TCK]